MQSMFGVNDDKNEAAVNAIVAQFDHNIADSIYDTLDAAHNPALDRAANKIFNDQPVLIEKIIATIPAPADKSRAVATTMLALLLEPQKSTVALTNPQAVADALSEPLKIFYENFKTSNAPLLTFGAGEAKDPDERFVIVFKGKFVDTSRNVPYTTLIGNLNARPDKYDFVIHHDPGDEVIAGIKNDVIEHIVTDADEVSRTTYISPRGEYRLQLGTQGEATYMASIMAKQNDGKHHVIIRTVEE
jgi:hypothetical protein